MRASASLLLDDLMRLGDLYHDPHIRRINPTLHLACLRNKLADSGFSETRIDGLVDDLHRASEGSAAIATVQPKLYPQHLHAAHAYVARPASSAQPEALQALHRTGIGRFLMSPKPDVDVHQLAWPIHVDEALHVCRLPVGRLLKELDARLIAGTMTPEIDAAAIVMPTTESLPSMATAIRTRIQLLRSDRQRLLALLWQAVAPYRAAKPAQRQGGIT